MIKENGRLKKAYYSSITSALYQIITIICGFVTSKLIIDNYGSSWNGVIASITRFLSLFLILEAGINGATRVALYKSFAENDINKTSGIIKANDIYYRKISIILIAYVCAFAYIVPTLSNSDKPNLAISCMVLIIGLGNFAENCWGMNSKILLMASQSRYIINIVQSIITIANVIALAIIVHSGGSIFVAKIGNSIFYTILPITLFLISRRLFKINKDAKPDNSALKGRWDVLANSISNIIHENVDIIVLTIVCTSEEVSVYSLYYLVAGGLTKVFQVVINGVEAGFGNMWVRNEMGTIKSRLRQFEFIMSTLAVLLFGCMIVLIVPFMSIYTKGVTDVNYQRYALGVFMGVAQVLMSFRYPYVLLVQAAGHYKQVKLGAYIEAGLNILLTLLLVQRYGILGAILGTIVANGFRTIQYGWYVSKKMIQRPIRTTVYRLLWASTVMTLTIVLSTFAIQGIVVTGWLMWVIISLITFVIHVVVILIASCVFYKSDLIDTITIVKRMISR